MQVQDRTRGQSASSEDRQSLETQGLYRLGLAYGRQVYRFRWFIIAFWVVALAASIPFMLQVGDTLKSGGYSYTSSESSKVDTIITDKFKPAPTQFLVVFQSTSTSVSDAAYQQEVSAFESRARAYPNVIGVQQSAAGLDGRTLYVSVSMSTPEGTSTKHVSEFRALLPSGPAASPAQVYLTGAPAIDSAFNKLSLSDVEHAEFAALPIALLVLLIVFGTLVAAAMPLLLALVSVLVTLALIYIISLHIDMNIYVLNIASIIGLGISIDYSLFMTRRFRDELARGRGVIEAIGWTIATSGEAILFSGLIVMIGFMGLLLIGIPFMSSLGIGGAVVVLTSVLGALTLLPALFSVLGPRINALRIPFISRFNAPRKQTSGEEEGKGQEDGEREKPGSKNSKSFWQRWAEIVMRRPLLVILAVTAMLIGMGWPIFSIELGTPSVSSLPTSDESRHGIDVLNAQFPETRIDPVLIIAQSPDGSSMFSVANIAKLDALSKWIASQPHVTGLVTSATSGNTTLITVETNAPLDSSAGNGLINDLRAGDTHAGQGLTVLVGGTQASDLDFNNYLYGNFPRSVLFILGATYMLLLLMFRSVILPLKAILMNVLSVAATYGVLVFIFQWGHFSNLLGFTPNGFLDSTNPILLFCILFGLSMDYEVFLLSRIHEEWLRTRNNRYAVARGLEKTGGVITNAALLFVIVTGAFTFTSLLVTKEIGLGMSLAVLVDATIIRTLLVPATMRLVGRWNWWLPGRPVPKEEEV